MQLTLSLDTCFSFLNVFEFNCYEIVAQVVRVVSLICNNLHFYRKRTEMLIDGRGTSSEAGRKSVDA